MPSGGHSQSGPKADPNALRRLRADDKGWTTLPSEGRGDVPAPDWPLTAATPRELVLWERWWRKPEATLWESDGSIDYVALTVRMFSEAEVTKASAENRKTVRQMMIDLYLTRDAKDRARIKIAVDEDKRDEKAAATAPQSSSRDRLTVVDGAGA